MRRIRKGAPPKAAVELDARGTRWGEEGPGQKAALREAALAEQRSLCAYCNRRIENATSTKLEHWVPRSDPACRHFHWPNLLAVCDGGESSGGRERWCDKARGNEPLTLHPAGANPDPERSVRYLADGHVRGSDDALHRELTEVLGLDASLLVRARRQAIDAVLDRITRARAHDRSGDTVRALEELAASYDDSLAKLPPFPCAVRPLIAQALRQARGRADALRR